MGIIWRASGDHVKSARMHMKLWKADADHGESILEAHGEAYREHMGSIWRAHARNIEMI